MSGRRRGSGYESLLRTCVLPTFGTTPLARVEQPAVASWVAEMRARGLSASRIRQAYRVLSSLMDAAVQGGYLARTPCAGIRLPRAARRDATLLTAAEVDRLAKAAGEYGTLIYLLAYRRAAVGRGRRPPAPPLRSAPAPGGGG